MQDHDIVVVGASAGGVEALSELVGALPADLGAAVFVVMHFPSGGNSVMAKILDRTAEMPASAVENGEPIETGQIYVARPDFHLLLEPGQVRLSHGPHENGFRPAIDALFRSSAEVYGPRVIGVILSGALDDGTVGLAHIKHRGGLAIVQEPGEALFSEMPESAIAHVDVDYVLPLAEIASTLVDICGRGEPHLAEAPVEETNDLDGEIVAHDKREWEARRESGERSVITCPECGGVLWEFDDGDILRFRCHTGHIYSVESVVGAQSQAIEAALWTAVRALEERVMLLRRLASRSREHGHGVVADKFERRAASAEHHSLVIRSSLLEHPASEQVEANDEDIA